MKTISKENLEKIYKENTNDKAAEILGISVPTMLKYVKQAGIEIKGAGAHNKAYTVVG